MTILQFWLLRKWLGDKQDETQVQKRASVFFIVKGNVYRRKQSVIDVLNYREKL